MAFLSGAHILDGETDIQRQTHDRAQHACEVATARCGRSIEMLRAGDEPRQVDN